MKVKLKKSINTEEKKTLISNFLSLAILQGANYVLPLLTLPYLVRVLGVENFGLLAFATATIAYFQVLTDYGFDLAATRQISINRGDPKKIAEIFSSVMIIKFLLMLLSFFILSVVVSFFTKFSNDSKIFYLTFGLVLGQVMFPVWFFQGMEKMKYITYINLTTRIFFTIAIFIFIKTKDDYYLVPVLNSLGVILGGAYALYFIRMEFKIKISIQSFSTLKFYLIEAHHIFISKLAISLYTVSTTFILGLFTNNTVVGYFAAGDKIIQAFKGLVSPVTQTIYPYISKLVSGSKEDALKFIKKVALAMAVFTAIVSLFVFVFAEYLVLLLLGESYTNSIVVVKIMALMPFMIGMSNVFGIQTMLTFDRKVAFTKILIAGSVLNIILSVALVPIYNHIGSAVSVLIVESFITLAMFFYLQRNGLKIIGENK